MFRKQNQNSEITVFQIVINALCAVIWAYVTVRRYRLGQSGWDFGITLLCALMWTVLTVLLIIRYVKQKKGN